MRRRLIRLLIVTVLFAPFLMLSGIAQGVSVTDFSGWDMAGKATAIQFVFDSPSLGIPASPTGEMNLAYSEATLQSGPAAYGLGSSAWPGQVPAALPTFLQGEIERQAGQEFFPVDLPNYPVRAESFFPQGPTSDSLDAGSIHMRSSAKETTSEGVSYLNKFEIPFIASMGNQSSFAQTGFDTQGAVTMVEGAATDLSFLNGLIRIDSVVTRATARSDGVKGTVAGTTTITGARVTGVGDVIIDTEGVKIAEQSIGVAPAQQALNQVLNQAGVSMQLSKPVDTITGPKAQRSLGGLVISVKSETVEPLITALPDDLEREIRGQLTLDQTIAIQVAPAAVSAGAVKNIEFPVAEEPPTVGGLDETPVGDSSSVGDVTPSDTGGGDSGPIAAPVTGGVPTGGVATINTSFKGIPLWALFLLMIAAFVASRPLTALADRALAARTAVACPLEER